MQPLVPGKPPKQKRFGWLTLLIASAVALFVGTGIGAAGDPATTAVPAATVTATATETVEAENQPPSEEPEPEPTEEPAPVKFKRSDFTVGIKILSKQCFGSAGCNVEFRIDPQYVGSQPLPDTGVGIEYEENE